MYNIRAMRELQEDMVRARKIVELGDILGSFTRNMIKQGHFGRDILISGCLPENHTD